MRASALLILVVCLFGGCKPTAREFLVESSRAFEPYVSGDVQSAKAALLAEERVIAKFEAAGTPEYDFHVAYVCTYARLCAVSIHLGDTNQASEYFQRVLAHRKLMRSPPTSELTMETVLQDISKLDAPFNPKWRQIK